MNNKIRKYSSKNMYKTRYDKAAVTRLLAHFIMFELFSSSQKNIAYTFSISQQKQA